MKNFRKLGGIGVCIALILSMFILSCCTKKVTDNQSKVDTTLVTFNNDKQMQAQIVVLKQFDSLSVIINKQSKIIDSLVGVKTKIQYVDKIIYKDKLSSKYNDKQIDSIIQSNVNLRNIIKHQNRMGK